MSATNGTTDPAKNNHSHWHQVYILMFVGLPLLSIVFLVLEHATHFEFLLHLAAIPLEILLGAFLVERFLAKKEKQAKLQQLMYIKSYIFRSELRNVYLTNFRALESPRITMDDIADSNVNKLRAMREDVRQVKYGGPALTEPVVMAYAQSHRIFQMFLEWSIANDFENIFHDMLNVLHFIQDVKLFKLHHPDKLFMAEAEKQAELSRKVQGIFHDGVCKFLDYVIELKEKQPGVFDEIMADYKLSSHLKRVDRSERPMRRQTDLFPEGAGFHSPSHPGMRMMNISP